MELLEIQRNLIGMCGVFSQSALIAQPENYNASLYVGRQVSCRSIAALQLSYNCWEGLDFSIL